MPSHDDLETRVDRSAGTPGLPERSCCPPPCVEGKPLLPGFARRSPRRRRDLAGWNEALKRSVLPARNADGSFTPIGDHADERRDDCS
jgi:hypothetical protein